VPSGSAMSLKTVYDYDNGLTSTSFENSLITTKVNPLIVGVAVYRYAPPKRRGWINR